MRLYAGLFLIAGCRQPDMGPKLLTHILVEVWWKMCKQVIWLQMGSCRQYAEQSRVSWMLWQWCEICGCAIWGLMIWHFSPTIKCVLHVRNNYSETSVVVYRPIGWRTCLQSRDRKFDWDPGIKTLIPRRRCRSRALWRNYRLVLLCICLKQALVLNC